MVEQAATGPAGQAAEAPKDKKGKMLPVIIAAYVLAALSAAALVERVLAPGMAGIPAPVHQQVVYVTGGAQAAKGGHGKKEKKKEGHGEGGGSADASSGNVYLIEDLVVNPAGSGGMRYLAASIGLRSNLDGFMVSMKSSEAPVKDALIRILSSKTVEELADVSLRESMREEILGEVQRITPDEDVDAVYFMRFVLQ